MSETSGVVTFTFSKKAGNRGGKIYSFIINDDGIWYSCGFEDPKLKEGDSISFSFEEDEWAPGKVSNKVDLSSIVVEEKAPDKPKPTNKKQKQGAGGTKVQENWDARAKYWENKEGQDIVRQNIISYQAAFNTATTILTTMCKSNPDVYMYLAGNTAKTQKKPGVQIENFTTNVEALATEIVGKFIQGDLVVKQLQEAEALVNGAVDHTDGDADLDD
jgi:hypothetical protein